MTKTMPKVMGGVEGLEVFQRAYRLSLEVHRESFSWPKLEQWGGVAEQLRRSSKSVCANLVEGGGRLARSRGEFGRYLIVAIGSADESRLWCRYAEDLGYITAQHAQGWRASFAEIARMLHGLLQSQTVQKPLLSDN